MFDSGANFIEFPDSETEDNYQLDLGSIFFLSTKQMLIFIEVYCVTY